MLSYILPLHVVVDCMLKSCYCLCSFCHFFYSWYSYIYCWNCIGSWNIFSITDSKISSYSLQMSNLSNFYYLFTKSDITFFYFSNKSKSDTSDPSVYSCAIIQQNSLKWVNLHTKLTILNYVSEPCKLTRLIKFLISYELMYHNETIG